MQKIAIDLRQNGGGDLPCRRKYLVDELARPPEAPGYVITGARTFFPGRAQERHRLPEVRSPHTGRRDHRREAEQLQRERRAECPTRGCRFPYSTKYYSSCSMTAWWHRTRRSCQPVRVARRPRSRARLDSRAVRLRPSRTALRRAASGTLRFHPRDRAVRGRDQRIGSACDDRGHVLDRANRTRPDSPSMVGEPRQFPHDCSEASRISSSRRGGSKLNSALDVPAQCG